MDHAEQRIEQAFERYGTTMAVKNMTDGSQTEFKGFLQPLRYKNKMYLGATKTALGYDNSGKFLLIAPPDVDISSADGFDYTVTMGGNHYSCDHCELEYLGETALYLWAVVTRC